jgi:LysM domain
MSPAITLAWFVVGVSLVSILVTETLPVARAFFRTFAVWSPSLGRLAAAAGIGLLLVSLVRPQPSGAATPPPSDRIVLMATKVDESVVPFVPMFGLRTSLPGEESHSYTVVRGDSLWAIARSHLADNGAVSSGSAVSTLWRMIFEVNRSVIGDDPNLILPGQVLTIPGGPYG